MTDAEFMKRHDAGCEVIGRGTGVPDSLCNLVDHICARTGGANDGMIAALGDVLLRYRDAHKTETALRGELAELTANAKPYARGPLETAACLWEAVLELCSGETSPGGLKEAVQASREMLGTSELRSTVIGWAEAVDAAWREADTDGGKFPDGGQYENAFDWEFVPNWIAENIDWSDPERPHIERVAIDAPAAPGHWDEVAGYPVADWQSEVANGDTRLGYAAWCEAMAENDAGDDPAQCENCSSTDNDGSDICTDCGGAIVNPHA
jgi:hypothetical protein